jgi:hypothetical protein
MAIAEASPRFGLAYPGQSAQFTDTFIVRRGSDYAHQIYRSVSRLYPIRRIVSLCIDSAYAKTPPFT